MRKIIFLLALIFLAGTALSAKPDLYVSEISKGESEFAGNSLKNFDFNVSIVTDYADANGFKIEVMLHGLDRTPMKIDEVEFLKTTEKKVIIYHYSSMVVAISGTDSNNVNGDNVAEGEDKNTVIFIQVDSENSVDESNEENNVAIIELDPANGIKKPDFPVDDSPPDDDSNTTANGNIIGGNEWKDVPANRGTGIIERLTDFLDWFLGNLFLSRGNGNG